jgi:hypothetical protein
LLRRVSYLNKRANDNPKEWDEELPDEVLAAIDAAEAQQQRPEKRPTIRNNPAVTPKPGIGKLPTPVIQFINDADNDILVDDEFLKM